MTVVEIVNGKVVNQWAAESLHIVEDALGYIRKRGSLPTGATLSVENASGLVIEIYKV